MDDNLQFEEGGTTKIIAKSGRRTRLPANQSFEELRPARKSSTSASLGEGPPSKPARRQGGWAEESSGSGSAKSSRRRAAEDLEDHRLRPQTPQGSDDEGDIPVIPDLEEVQEEDLTTQVAAPPRCQVNRVMTYSDLDNDLKHFSSFQTLVSQGHLFLCVFIPFTLLFKVDFPVSYRFVQAKGVLLQSLLRTERST
uniref:Intraflagellar transport 43 n=1 Tax=Fundulus heteroclitus TaxID=8078 RepID=A0A3Q2TIK7_FUNHE